VGDERETGRERVGGGKEKRRKKKISRCLFFHCDPFFFSVRAISNVVTA
jgi:hypothetical protein